MEVFIIRDGAGEEDAGGVDHGHATITFPTEGVVIERLGRGGVR